MKFRVENKHKIIIIEAESTEQLLKIAQDKFGMDNNYLKIRVLHEPKLPLQDFENAVKIAVKKLRMYGW